MVWPGPPLCIVGASFYRPRSSLPRSAQCENTEGSSKHRHQARKSNETSSFLDPPADFWGMGCHTILDAGAVWYVKRVIPLIEKWHSSHKTITRSTVPVHTSTKGTSCQCCDMDQHHRQNLIICSLVHCRPSLKISCKSVWKFCTKLLTDRQTTMNT